MDNSPLSKLSAEIRNEIYELVLCPPGGIQIGFVDGTVAAVKLVHPPPEQKICSLLATCRGIREECRPMLYGANFFQVNELSLSGETFRRKGGEDVRVQRYSECMKELQDVLPLFWKAQIDMGTWRWSSNEVERSDECRSLVECCHVLCDTIPKRPTEGTADLQGLLKIDANDSNKVAELHRQSLPYDPAESYDGPVTLLFDLRDLSTLSVTLVQQQFRIENQRLQRLRTRGAMALQQYSTEIMRLHNIRRRIVPLIAEVVAMEPKYRAQAPKVTPKVTEGPGRQSTGPGLTDDLAMVAGDFYALNLESA
ncbi:hypothetical protein KC333_g6875 [Hortaea werneckii]|nr:hypothetical protein KC333_g6875 [Hortaea werneckii]KAI7310095.1 hypothetical protein KC326_g6832 [Hortaea werneckii]